MSRAFFDYWRERAAFVDSLQLPARHHEANVLALAAIDSLANLWQLAFKHSYSSHARRFAEFLISCSGKADIFERISLPYVRWKARETLPRFQPHVLSVLENCGLSSPQPPDPYSEQARRCRLISDDPPLPALLGSQLASVATATTAKGLALHDWLLDCRLGTILYVEYRCFWLHEGRSGHATHSFDVGTGEPTYLTNDFAMPPLISFPVPFLVSVLRSCIDNFEHTAQQASVNPVPPPHMPGIVIDAGDDDAGD